MLRAARALLGLEQSRFGLLAGVGQRTIARMEAEDLPQPDARRRRAVETLRKALETDFGIEFIFDDGTGGEGVRFRKSRLSG
jgi:predicted transcriptional regulator